MEFQENAQSQTRGQGRWASLVGYGVLVAVVFFILGNRWGSIVDGSANADNAGGTSETTTELPADLDYSSVEEVYDTLKKRFDGELTSQALLDGIKEGLARASGDDYTVYLNAEEAQKFRNDLNGTFTGIGAEIGLDKEQLIIVAPLKGFAAEAAGVRAQDRILEIDGERTTGMSVEEAVAKIRGEAGTAVKLKLLRNSSPIDVEITRAEITIPSVEYEIRDDHIGYIQLSRFAEDTKTLMHEAAQAMVDAKVKGVVLDLRNNSGGFLDASVEVLDLWVDDQVVVEQRRGDTVTQALKTFRGAQLGTTPTVVLVNEGSASASEIVAGAMQDLNKATLVGAQTFGKGSVQALEELDGGGVLKVTIARWYTPKGNNIDESGVTPDEKIEITEEDFAADHDPQLDRAIKLLLN